MKSLSDRIRRLHSGYQGLDDQVAIIREVEELQEKLLRLEKVEEFFSEMQTKLCWQESMLRRAEVVARNFPETSVCTYDIETNQSCDECYADEFLYDLEKGPK